MYRRRGFLVFGVSSPAPADEKLSFVTDTFVFVFRLLKANPLVNNRGFPFKGNNSGTHFRNYNVFRARKPCRIDDLLPLNFRTQMVSPIQNILTKNLEIICRVILTKTSQKMIVNLLMMVLIYLPICQHHVSGYVLSCMTSAVFFFFLLLIEIISIAKLLIIVHFLVWKYEKQTLSYIHTKFEGDWNTWFFFLIYFVGAPVFLPQHWKLLGPERLMPLKSLGMNCVNLLVSVVKPLNCEIHSCHDWTENCWILFWKLKV